MNKFNTFKLDTSDWKSTGLMALAIWIVLALLESFLFVMVLFLIKVVL